MIFDSIQAVVNIFILIGIGALLTRIGWITPQNRPLISKLVVLLAVPCTIFNNLYSAIDKQAIAASGNILLTAAASVCVMYFGGWILSKTVLRVRKNRQRTFAAMASCPNTVFIGLPIVIALFGDAGVPTVMFFLIAQTTLFWSLGNAGIQADGQGAGRFSLRDMLKKVFSVNLIVIIVVFAMVWLDIKPPGMATSIAKYIGSLTTPLSLFFSGNALYEIYNEFGFRGLRPDRDVYAIVAARFIIAPLLALLFCMLFGVTGIPRIVCVLISSMPIMVNNVILCGAYGADRDYAAVSLFWTVLLSVVIIPIYMVMLA